MLLTQTPLWSFHHFFTFWDPVGPLWNSLRHFLFTKDLDPTWVKILRIALLWIVLWLCCQNNELWSAIGDTHCMKTKWLKDSNKFVVQKFGRSFLKLFFSCADGGSTFPNLVQKWKFQNAHGKVLFVVYDQAIGIKYWKHCVSILPVSLAKSNNIYLFIA